MDAKVRGSVVVASVMNSSVRGASVVDAKVRGSVVVASVMNSSVRGASVVDAKVRGSVEGGLNNY